MAAPVKVWTILPVQLTSTPVQINYFIDEVEAEKAAIRASISTNTQYYHFEAIAYVEPEIPDAIVSALVIPIT